MSPSALAGVSCNSERAVARTLCGQGGYFGVRVDSAQAMVEATGAATAAAAAAAPSGGIEESPREHRQPTEAAIVHQERVRGATQQRTLTQESVWLDIDWFCFLEVHFITSYL